MLPSARLQRPQSDQGRAPHTPTTPGVYIILNGRLIAVCRQASTSEAKHVLEDVGIPVVAGIVVAVVVALFCVVRAYRRAQAAREAEKRENLLL